MSKKAKGYKKLSRSELAYIDPYEEAYRASFTATCYFDGSLSFGKIGYSTVVVENTTGQIIHSSSNTIKAPKSSSNVAEYKAFITTLHFINKTFEGANILILGDSLLVVEQMNNRKKINNGIYKEQALIAKELLYTSKQKNRIVIQWISRFQNTIADSLSKCEKNV